MKIQEITEGLFGRIGMGIRTKIDNAIGQRSLESLGYILGVANTIGLEFIKNAIGEENTVIFLEAVQMARNSEMLNAQGIARAVEQGISDARQADSTLDDMIRIKFDKLKAGMNYIRGSTR